MSLTKLFNKNYAFQNIKKSKGILAIMLIAIPIITLFFLYNYDNTSYSSPYNMNVLIGANLLGMFIIPFILSNVLLGYVYQKNSIDFVNSMPISRKKIYLTNIIIGILYLVILQFINFLIASIYVLIVKESNFSISMICDSFLIMTTGYTFLFIISSLALTVSGNKFTQIVVASIILCLIPFIRLVNFWEMNRDEISLINYEGIKEPYLYDRQSLFTIPVDTIVKILDGENIYNIKAVGITAILSIVYIYVGIKLFEKRKMENTGSSFKSEKIHLIIKAITLYPMIVVLSQMYNSIKFPELVLLVFLMFVYYFVYDLITNKKIKLKITFLSFILSCVILFGINFSLNKINENFYKNKEIYLNDIETIELNLSEIFFNYSDKSDDSEFAKISNKETIDFIFDNLESGDYAYLSDKYTRSWEETNRISIKMKVKNGKTIKYSGRLNRDSYIKLLNKILEDENYVKDLTENYKIKKDSIVRLNGSRDTHRLIITDKDNFKQVINNNVEEYIRKKINSEINEYTNLSNSLEERNPDNIEIEIYSYSNHTRKFFSMPFELVSQEMRKEVVRKINNYTKQIIEDLKGNEDEYYSFNFEKVNLKNNEHYTGDLPQEVIKNIVKFIKEDENKDFDLNKEYYIISEYYKGINYFTNDITSIENIVGKELLKENKIEDIEIKEEVIELNTINYQ